MTTEAIHCIGIPAHDFNQHVWSNIVSIYGAEVLRSDKTAEEVCFGADYQDVLDGIKTYGVSEHRLGSIWTPDSKLEVSSIRGERRRFTATPNVEVTDDPILLFDMYPNMREYEITAAVKNAKKFKKPDPESLSALFRNKVAHFLTESGVAVSIISSN